MPLRLHIFSTSWIVPRKAMCGLFWLGVLLLFAGIILLVTSKHKGVSFHAWGGVVVGLGFCILIVCLVLCIHAYWVIAVAHAEPAEQHKKCPPAPSQQRQYELPPDFSAVNGRLNNAATITQPLKTPRQQQQGIDSASNKFTLDDQLNRLKYVTSSITETTTINERRATDRVKLLDNSSSAAGGGALYYTRTIPSTIDEEDETSTNSATPSMSISLATPPSLTTPSSVTTPLSHDGQNAAQAKSLGVGVTPSAPAPPRVTFKSSHSYPLVTPPSLPSPPKLVTSPSRSLTPPTNQISMSKLVTPSLRSSSLARGAVSSGGSETKTSGLISTDVDATDFPSEFRSGQSTGRVERDGQGRPPSAPSSAYPEVVVHDGRRTPSSANTDREVSRVTARVTPLVTTGWGSTSPTYVDDVPCSISVRTSGRGRTGDGDGKTNGGDGRTSSGDGRTTASEGRPSGAGGRISGGESRTSSGDGRTSGSDGQMSGAGGRTSGGELQNDMVRVAESRTFVGNDTRFGRPYLSANMRSAPVDESDFSPTVTLDWTASDESYQMSSTSEESTPHTVTSPESTATSTNCAASGPAAKRTPQHQQSSLAISAHQPPSSQKPVPTFRAHSAALVDPYQSTTLSPGGLMMRPFVDGMVTVTPLVGDGTYPKHVSERLPPQHQQADAMQSKNIPPGMLRPSNGNHPADLEDIASNITESSIDSKVTIYDNVHYLYV